MKILVSGSNSQISLELKKDLDTKNHNFFFLEKDEFNITKESDCKKVFSKFKPDILINTAAFTNVAEAENRNEESNNINAESINNLSNYCNIYSCFFIHFSTDYVFDGLNKDYLYSENDTTNPKTIYGKSKLAGEKIILNTSNSFMIIRLSWLYSSFKNNFVSFVIDQAIKNNNIIMIEDSYSIPTSTKNIKIILDKILNNFQIDKFNKEIFHLCDDGKSISPFELSTFIFQVLEEKGYKTPNLLKTKYSKFNLKVKRPINSSLDNTKIKKDLSVNLFTWEDNVYKTIEEILS